MAKGTHNFLSRIIDFFKRIFKINNQSLLVEADSGEEQVSTDTRNFKQEVKNNVSENYTSDSEKNITMFLYKQLRLGKLEPKYIPDQYLEKIATLLKEEKKIKQRELDSINEEILQNEQKIKKYSGNANL